MAKKKRHSASVEVFDASPSYSIGDPAFADFLRIAGAGWSGSDITESSALGITAFYRACALISGTIAGLPLHVYRDTGTGRERVDHFLSSAPAGPYDLSAFAWTEMLVLHQLLHGETFLKSIENGGGELIGLWPVHPLAVTKVAWEDADKRFWLAMADGTQEQYVSGQVTHIPVMSTDGLRGVAPLSVFRQSLQTIRAGETSANRTFSSGALISGLVTTEEDVDEEEAKAIKGALDAKMMGSENAGTIAFVNRSLKFSPWKMTNVDAQFLESRAFGVAEVARMFGLPVHLLSVAGAVSNWGTGVAEANLALQKYVLMGYTSRIESALRTILPPGWFAEFDYRGLLQGTPKEEIDLLVAQVAGGLLTTDEARAIMNLPPMPEADRPDPMENTDAEV